MYASAGTASDYRSIKVGMERNRFYWFMKDFVSVEITQICENILRGIVIIIIKFTEIISVVWK